MPVISPRQIPRFNQRSGNWWQPRWITSTPSKQSLTWVLNSLPQLSACLMKCAPLWYWLICRGWFLGDFHACRRSEENAFAPAHALNFASVIWLLSNHRQQKKTREATTKVNLHRVTINSPVGDGSSLFFITSRRWIMMAKSIAAQLSPKYYLWRYHELDNAWVRCSTCLRISGNELDILVDGRHEKRVSFMMKNDAEYAAMGEMSV